MVLLRVERNRQFAENFIPAMTKTMNPFPLTRRDAGIYSFAFVVCHVFFIIFLEMTRPEYSFVFRQEHKNTKAHERESKRAIERFIILSSKTE